MPHDKICLMESEVQRAICDYLALRKVFFFRCNNKPIFDPTRKVFRALPKYTPKGIGDILAVKDGKAIFIEVKRDKAAWLFTRRPGMKSIHLRAAAGHC